MGCPCAGCQGTAGVQYVLVPMSMGERHTILQGLAKLEFGFARDIAERLEATRCESCGGNGAAPYVGGDDDNARCERCHGHGFKTRLPAGCG